jgi:hypothetical protein
MADKDKPVTALERYLNRPPGTVVEIHKVGFGSRVLRPKQEPRMQTREFEPNERVSIITMDNDVMVTVGLAAPERVKCAPGDRLEITVEPNGLFKMRLYSDESEGPDEAGLRRFWVWVEGFAVTGQQGHAQLCGTALAKTFKQACDLVMSQPPWKDNYDPKDGTHWGCRLFDNEADARKKFG